MVPLAGLLGETGLTLREDEVAALRMLAATAPDVLERMLLSGDHFCDTSSSELTVELRRSLLDRLGLFGVRLAISEIQSGRATTAAALGPVLVEHSGLTALRRLITSHFMPRARILQARSALVALRAISRQISSVVPAVAADLDRQLEQIEASTVQFAQVRGAHLVASGAVSVSPADRAELDRLFSSTEPGAALGMSAAATDQIQAVALQGISKWRSAGADPLADPTYVEVCDTAARVLESIYGATLARS